MTDKIAADFIIRSYQPDDREDVIHIWDACGLIRAWNDPALDIARKIATQKELFFVGEYAHKLIATVMFGYEGHRGWLNYFAVLPDFQKKSLAERCWHLAKKD